MKFIVAFALIFLGVCNIDSAHITNYGNTNTTVLNFENIFEDRLLTVVHNKTVTMPWVNFRLF